jgi:hypothetical protein
MPLDDDDRAAMAEAARRLKELEDDRKAHEAEQARQDAEQAKQTGITNK